LTDHDIELVVNKAIVNEQCTQFSLWNNEITSDGASIFADSLSNNTNTFVCNSTINILVDMLLQNQSLKKFYLNNCSLSELDKERLIEITNLNDEFFLST
jgi:hypothetical protein